MNSTSSTGSWLPSSTGVVAAFLDGFALGVGTARSVEDVQNRIRVGEFVQELVAQPPALVGTGDESGDIEQFDRDVARAVETAVVAAPLVEIETGTLRADGGDPAVGVDGRKGVVGHVDVGQRGGRVEGRLARVRFPRERKREHTTAFVGGVELPFGPAAGRSGCAVPLRQSGGCRRSGRARPSDRGLLR